MTSHLRRCWLVPWVSEELPTGSSSLYEKVLERKYLAESTVVCAFDERRCVLTAEP
jgi:hypothetical protein